MNHSNVWRWTGVFGLAAVALGLAQFPLYSTGITPSVYDGAAFGLHLFTGWVAYISAALCALFVPTM